MVELLAACHPLLVVLALHQEYCLVEHTCWVFGIVVAGPWSQLVEVDHNCCLCCWKLGELPSWEVVEVAAAAAVGVAFVVVHS